MKKKNLLVSILVSLIAVSSLTFAGCGTPNTSTTEPADTAPQPSTSNSAETTLTEEQTTEQTATVQTIFPSLAVSSGDSSKARYSSIYQENLNRYQTLTDTYTKKLETVFNTLGKSYESYTANVASLEEWYESLENDYIALFEETSTVTAAFIEKVKTEMKDSEYSEWNDELDYLYEDYYSGAMDDLYDAFYSGLFDDIYDEYYSGVLYDQPENVEYRDWDKVRSACYKSWDKAKSTFYKKWDKAKSNIYKSWDKAKSYMYKLK